MGEYYYHHEVSCHWCGKLFNTKQPTRKHVFCSNACKMAHHRAYKKYVTQKRSAERIVGTKKVTHKTKKKKPATTDSAGDWGGRAVRR